MPRADANSVYSLLMPRYFSMCLVLWPHQGVANPAMKAYSEQLLTSRISSAHVGHVARLRLLPVAVFYLLVVQTKVSDPTQTVKLPEPS